MASLVGCRPSAAPVVVGERPVAVNGRPVKDAQARPWKPVPEMSWTGSDDRVVKIKDLSGKVLILDFWATYCPPCIEAIPHLMELKARYPNDIEVIGLHVGDEEDRVKVPEFVERLKITYPLGFPEDALTAYVFGTDTAIPQSAIIDREGKMVKKLVGFNEDIKRELDETVAAAVAGQ